MSGTQAGKGHHRRAYNRKNYDIGADLYYANLRNAKARKKRAKKKMKKDRDRG